MAGLNSKDYGRLVMLKQDLQLMTDAFDSYLTDLLHTADSFIAREGITLTDTDEDRGLSVMYAAYLYRKRADPVGTMPRMLRYALNNRKFGKKGASSDETEC